MRPGRGRGPREKEKRGGETEAPAVKIFLGGKKNGGRKKKRRGKKENEWDRRRATDGGHAERMFKDQ